MAVYPCCSDGEEIMLVEPDNYDKEVARFDFAPVVGSRKKDVVCAADYFKPMGNGGVDAVGLQLCTAGPEVEDQINAFRESGDSESCLYLQGLSDRIAEDVAGLLHSRLRERLGFSGDSDIGIRWSPGYPAMPNTDNNRGLLELLQAEKHIGVRITEAGEFAPTGTTGAVVCFHPDARYT
jgi:5-methyltetrahydrofolate--homocysteine methyltransferase